MKLTLLFFALLFSLAAQDLNYALPWICSGVTPDYHSYSCTATFLDGSVIHGTQLSAPQVGQFAILYPRTTNQSGPATLSTDGGVTVFPMRRISGRFLQSGDLTFGSIYTVYFNGSQWRVASIMPASTTSVGPVGGTPLVSGQCLSTSIAAPGAGGNLTVSPLSDPGDGVYFYGFFSSGMVTVKICAVVPVTPNAVIYQIGVQ